MALGTLYAGIESACRELRDKAAAIRQQNISILTDAQRAKLNVLNDALKLAPTISEAQSGNLLGAAGFFPSVFTNSSGSTIGGIAGSYVLFGCSSPGLFIRTGDFTEIQSAQLGTAGLSTTTPAPANRIVNNWFDRIDFDRIPGTANGQGSLSLP